MKCKGLATLAVMGLVCVVCLVGAALSIKFLPQQEADVIEDGLETVAEDEIEYATHMSKGSLKDEVDEFFPHP
jgi:hypothetical protein